MLDWLMTYLASLQGGIVRSLAAELRAGGLGTAMLAFALGALHALTPGHGKAALAAYFLGREAPLAPSIGWRNQV
jgi:ABC-type nickel/cobalt efflux system permease component RcnA